MKHPALLCAILAVIVCQAEIPVFDVQGPGAEERYYPDISDDTLVWWEGGEGGQFVWRDWLREDDGVIAAASSLPLSSRIYKRHVVWSDAYSADPNIYLQVLPPDDTADVVSVGIVTPAEGDVLSNTTLRVCGVAHSLLAELACVRWRCLLDDGTLFDEGLAEGTVEWQFTLDLDPAETSCDIIVTATDAAGYACAQEITIFLESTGARRRTVRRAVPRTTRTTVCDAPGAQLNPDIDRHFVVWEDHRNGQGDIYLYDYGAATSVCLIAEAHDQVQPAVQSATVVWVDYRFGNADIFACNLDTGVVVPVCTNAADQLFPDVCGPYVVWQDSRAGNPDIWLCDLRTMQTQPICTNIWPQQYPRLSSRWIVWEDWRSDDTAADIYAYDITTRSEYAIDGSERSQQRPAIADSRAAWMNDADETWAVTLGLLEERVAINHGATLTKTPWVWLTLHSLYPYGTEMAIANDYVGGSAYDAAFQTGLWWRLPAIDGVRHVTAVYTYPNQEESGDMTSSIILDQNPPRVEQVLIQPEPMTTSVARITVNFLETGSGLDYGHWPSVTIRPMSGTTERIAGVAYANGVWRGVWSNTWNYSGVAVIGIAGARDLAGFVMAPNEFARTVTIGLFFTNASLLVQYGVATTTNAVVRVDIAAPGAAEMKLAQDPDEFEDTPWQTFGTPTPWRLEDEDDVNDIYVIVRDRWRNESPIMVTSIYYHASPTSPAEPVVEINGVSTHTPHARVLLLLSAQLAHSMRIGNSRNLASQPWVPYATRYEWQLLPGKGERTVHVQFRDVYSAESEIVSDTIMLSPNVAFTTAKDGDSNIVRFRYRGNGMLIIVAGTYEDDFDCVELVGADGSDSLRIAAINQHASDSTKSPVDITQLITDGSVKSIQVYGTVRQLRIGTETQPGTAQMLAFDAGGLEGLFARAVSVLRVRAGNLTGQVICRESLATMLLQGNLADADVQIGSRADGGIMRSWHMLGLVNARILVGLDHGDDPAQIPAQGSFGVLRGVLASDSIIAGAKGRAAARVRFQTTSSSVFYRTVNGVITPLLLP